MTAVVKVKQVIPNLSNLQLLNVMKEVFIQYDICKRIPGNAERDEYVSAIENIVNLLPDREKEVITQRYMIDSYRKDLQVYNFCLNPPVSKDTYTTIRNKAFAKLYISLSEKGILEPWEDDHDT